MNRNVLRGSWFQVMVVLIGGNGHASTLLAGTALPEEIQFRRPVAIVATADWIYTANRDAGSVSVIDATTHRVCAEVPVGQRLSDLAIAPGGTRLLALDEAAGTLIELTQAGPETARVGTVPVAPYPVSLSVDPDGRWCCVASLWSRQLTFLKPRPHIAGSSAAEYQHATTWQVTNKLNVSLAPRNQCLAPDGTRLVVADSFGGRLALVDPIQGTLVGYRSLDGHNIRGLANSADRRCMLVTHQQLSSHVPTNRPGVFWGAVMGNVIRAVDWAHLWEPARSQRAIAPPQQASRPPQSPVPSSAAPLPVVPLVHWSVDPLGAPGNAAGDPGAIGVRGSRTLVLLSGTHEVALRLAAGMPFERRTVGRRPVAVALACDKPIAYVANMFDDSVSVVRLDDATVTETISLGAQPPLTLSDEGELLFYDARLSLDQWYSCHSCHTDGHTNGLNNDNLGDGAYGAPKRILSLLGTRDTAPWAWDGSQSGVEDQVRKSLQMTMQGQQIGSDTEDHVLALTAYVRSLRPPPAVDALRGQLDRDAVQRGRQVFLEQHCTECHRPGTFTSQSTYDVGMPDEAGTSSFNPPSLLGLSQRDRYFHDGRARTLRQVLVTSEHGQQFALDDQQLADLRAYLESL